MEVMRRPESGLKERDICWVPDHLPAKSVVGGEIRQPGLVVLDKETKQETLLELNQGNTELWQFRLCPVLDFIRVQDDNGDNTMLLAGSFHNLWRACHDRGFSRVLRDQPDSLLKKKLEELYGKEVGRLTWY